MTVTDFPGAANLMLERWLDEPANKYQPIRTFLCWAAKSRYAPELGERSSNCSGPRSDCGSRSPEIRGIGRTSNTAGAPVN